VGRELPLDLVDELEVEVEQPAQVLITSSRLRCRCGSVAAVRTASSRDSSSAAMSSRSVSEKDRSSAKCSRPMVLGCPAESSR
jgi:hypothetical protein